MSTAEKTTTESSAQFLLASAADDFHKNGPTRISGFRNVRMGHAAGPDGLNQYLICGEFLPKKENGTAEWSPFATIKTSGYEQWLGVQAQMLCQRPTVTWDQEGDLSSALQKQFDSGK
jgi:hypothetical protein